VFQDTLGGCCFAIKEGASAGTSTGGTIQRIFQAFVVLALLVLSPALAQSRPATLPTQAAVVLPIGVELDEELAEVEGKWANVLMGAAFGAGHEIYHQMTTQGRVSDWTAVAINAGFGALGGALVGLGGSALEAFASGRAGMHFVAGAVSGSVRGHYDNSRTYAVEANS